MDNWILNNLEKLVPAVIALLYFIGSSKAKKLKPNAIIHMLEGGVKKGEIKVFDPSLGTVQVRLASNPTKESEIDLADVLAIFFGPQQGKEPEKAIGERLMVQLINDRRIGGLSPDYAPGVSSMKLVPDPRRGNIDYIWIPASSVKEIQLL